MTEHFVLMDSNKKGDREILSSDHRNKKGERAVQLMPGAALRIARRVPTSNSGR